MNKEDAIQQSLDLIDNAAVCIVGTIGENGFPNTKAMFSLRHNGLQQVWFSTNTSSKRVRQLRKDNRACLYYIDQENFKGLMLTGTMEILTDIESKTMLWSEGNEIYYPLGIEDPDYSVLRFTSIQGNFYHDLENLSFDIDLCRILSNNTEREKNCEKRV